MPEERTPPDDRELEAVSDELKARVCALVDALIRKHQEDAESGFVHLLTRAQELVDRKRAMEGTKTDTRDLVGELVFSRLRQAMRQFLNAKEARDEIRAAEWTIGCLFSIVTLTELSHAFDEVLIRQGMGRDFSFAGRTDFISVEEVLQMLAAGKHLGCLSLEKADNRLDVYLKDGHVAFLDPHHMIRRVMPGSDMMRHREIPEGVVALAEVERKQKGTPVFLTLVAKGHFRKNELRDIMRFFGKEVVFDFMCEREPYAFFYRRLDALPAFAEESNLRLSVTSMLLEGSKQVDDRRQLSKVFPDPKAPIEPSADMFARMADVTLGPLEIKLLSQINGEASPKALVPVLGVPLHDVYQLLVRLAREGILTAPGGDQALGDLTASVHESLQVAFQVLDANDDADAPYEDEDADLDLSELDQVLGDGSRRTQRPKGGTGKAEATGPVQRELLQMLRRNRPKNE